MISKKWKECIGKQLLYQFRDGSTAEVFVGAIDPTKGISIEYLDAKAVLKQHPFISLRPDGVYRPFCLNLADYKGRKAKYNKSFNYVVKQILLGKLSVIDYEIAMYEKKQVFFGGTLSSCAFSK